MIIYYATIFGASLGAFTALRKQMHLLYLARYVTIYASVFGLIAYFYTTLTSRSG